MDVPTNFITALDALAERITLSGPVPAHMRWLGADGIATMLDFKPRYLLERIACLPDFPKPLRVGGEGHPKWNVAEVQAWAIAHRSRHSAGRET